MNGRGFLRQVCVMIMFCLAHFLDGVARSLAAHAAGLDASIGHVVSPVARYFVDVHPAEIELLRCIEHCLQITCRLTEGNRASDVGGMDWCRIPLQAALLLPGPLL